MIEAATTESDCVRFCVIESHTGGEPTRVASGGPDLGSGALFERLMHLCTEHDSFPSVVVNEPRDTAYMGIRL